MKCHWVDARPEPRAYPEIPIENLVRHGKHLIPPGALWRIDIVHREGCRVDREDAMGLAGCTCNDLSVVVHGFYLPAVN